MKIKKRHVNKITKLVLAFIKSEEFKRKSELLDHYQKLVEMMSKATPEVKFWIQRELLALEVAMEADKGVDKVA